RLLQLARRRILGFVNGAASGIRVGVRPAGQRGQLKIVAVAGDDVEGTARRDIEQRGDGPVAEEFADKAVTADLPTLIYAAEHEALTLVEERSRAIIARVIAVLWRQRRLQVGGIVDGV